MSKKTILILVIVLFIGIIVQTTVVIDYYSESVNIGFFKSKNDAGTLYKTLDENIRDKFFTPYEIQVRFDKRAIIVGREDILFSNLWNDAQVVFENAVKKELTESTELWDAVCDNPGVSVTFGSFFPMEYFGYMLDMEIPEEYKINIDKIMILPGDEEMTVYFHTDESFNLKTSFVSSGLFTMNNFLNMIELLTKDPDFIRKSKMDFFRLAGTAPGAVWRNYMEADIMISFDLTPRYIPWIYVGIPDNISAYIKVIEENESKARTDAMNNFSESIKMQLLTKSANLYKTHYNFYGNLFFTNQFNMFEIQSDGWVSYRYTPGTEGDDKGSIGDAFVNAFETLESIMKLSQDGTRDMFVSGIEQNEDSYIFKFDYKYKSRVLAITGEPHAAVITATATRTIEAKVLPLMFTDMAENTQVEIPYIFDFNSNLILHGLNDLNKLSAYNIYVGYGPFSGGQNIIGPIWIFELKSGEKELYSLKKGEE